MSLRDKLDQCNAQLLQVLDPVDRKELEEAIERLRMLQLVEQGLSVGDILPDFALPGTDGQLVTSEALLERGPLALVFFRGPWCPYCSLALEALEEARPAIEDLGASLVAVAPMTVADLRSLAAERGLGLRLLSDPGAAYARICGVEFEMSEGGTALYRRLAARFGLQIDGLTPGADWELPIPASYVAGGDGAISFAYGDADWAKRAEPADIVAAVRRLAQAA
jgi:peroxiredoxin